MLEVVLNPLSREAKGLVRETGPLSEIPEAAFELARKKVLWRKEGRRPPRELLEVDPGLDIVSYHLLYQTAGLLSTPYSGETRLVKEVTHLLVKARLERLEARAGPEGAISRVRDLLDPQELVQSGRDYRLWGTVIKREVVLAESLSPIQGMKGMAKADTTPSAVDRRRMMYAVDWKAFLPLLGTKELKLTDWYIVAAEDETGRKRSCILVSLSNLLDLYARLVAAEALGYMNTMREKGKGLQVHERLKALGETLRTVSSSIYRPAATLGTPKSLNPGHFPPCIRYTLEGVTTGSRNYAISVLLTSFLSYARIAPQGRDSKISDYLKDMAVVTEEILPLIGQAAERCQPPLFEDQPLERLNVHYHLGFGLRGDMKLEDSGASKWYFPPNCEKIQRESPPLCRPDDFCKRIKNPLHYYFLKEREAGGVGKREEDRPKTEGLPKTVGEKLEGRIVEIQDGSGLIQRCPKCDRWIIDNFCIVHSDVEGIWDLRIKARLEYGGGSHNLIFKREAAEKATKITLEEARQRGEAPTLGRIKEALVGKNLAISGKKLDKNFIVKDIMEI